MTPHENPTTRRALFAAVPAIALPAVALATVSTAAGDDAQFLTWEREAKFWRAASNDGRPKTDDELDALVDRTGHFEELIATTAAAGLIGARVKAAYLLQSLEDGASLEGLYWTDRMEMAAIRSILDVITKAAG
jgi:hypothetical protein